MLNKLLIDQDSSNSGLVYTVHADQMQIMPSRYLSTLL